MTEETKETKEEAKKSNLIAPQEPVDPEITVEQVQAQLNYAQKIINVLQTKVNDANGVIVQLEARLLMAEEDKAGILKQLEYAGITPQ